MKSISWRCRQQKSRLPPLSADPRTANLLKSLALQNWSANSFKGLRDFGSIRSHAYSSDGKTFALRRAAGSPRETPRFGLRQRRRLFVLLDDCRAAWHLAPMPTPPTIAKLKNMGVLRFAVTCARANCRHSSKVTFEQAGLPENLHFTDIALVRRFTCVKCGGREVAIARSATDVALDGSAALGQDRLDDSAGGCTPEPRAQAPAKIRACVGASKAS